MTDAATDGFVALARRPPVVRRAAGYAVVVGAVLVGINHGDAVLAGEIGADRAWRIGLTVLVPYVVSTLSSVGALRNAAREAAREAERSSRSSA